jgi:uncharacterized membrane protein
VDLSASAGGTNNYLQHVFFLFLCFVVSAFAILVAVAVAVVAYDPLDFALHDLPHEQQCRRL